MTLAEPFAGGTSLLHRLDPRAKVVAAVVWSVALAVLTDLRVLAIGTLVSAALLAVAQLDPRRLARRLLAVNAFVAFLWLFLPWSLAGEAILRGGPFTVTREGLLLALRLTLRSNAIVCACLALLATSRLADLCQALRALWVPDKLVLVVFFCARYIDVLHDECVRMQAAIALRAFKAKTTLHAYRTYANLIGLLIVRSYDRAERVHDAMICRGFDGRLRSLRHSRLRPHDVIAVGLLTALTIILVVFECRTTS